MSGQVGEEPVGDVGHLPGDRRAEEVVEHYSSGMVDNPNLRSRYLRPPGFGFEEQEKADLVAFLKTLTDRSLTTDPRFSDPFRYDHSDPGEVTKAP